MFKNKIKSFLPIFFEIIAVLIIIIPTVVSAYYSVYNDDDLYIAYEMRKYSANAWEWFLGACKRMIGFYRSSGGTYICFFSGLLTSINKVNGWRQFHIIMTLNVLLFASSLAYFVIMAFKYLGLKAKQIMIMVIIYMAGVFAFYSWEEVFTYFVGGVGYALPLTFGFFGGGILLDDDKSKLKTSVASVCMFISSGGSLELAGLLCYLWMMFIIIKGIQKRLRRYDIIIFIAAFLGALIDACAPGNFVRSATIDDSGLHIFKAIVNSATNVVVWLDNVYSDTPFIVFFIIAMWCGFECGNKIDKKTAGIFIGLNILLPFVTAFPVSLGYGSNEFPNRCQFGLVISIVISSTLIAVTIGRMLKDKIEDFSIYKFGITLAVFYIVMIGINTEWKLSESKLFEMYCQVASGEFKDYYIEARQLHKSIEEDDNSDVFVTRQPSKISNYYCIDLKDDMMTYSCSVFALYYGKNSVQGVESVTAYTVGKKVFRIYPELFYCDLSHVSIFMVNNDTKDTEEIQILKPLDKNVMITADIHDNVTVWVYAFGDATGENLIGQWSYSFE